MFGFPLGRRSHAVSRVVVALVLCAGIFGPPLAIAELAWADDGGPGACPAGSIAVEADDYGAAGSAREAALKAAPTVTVYGTRAQTEARKILGFVNMTRTSLGLSKLTWNQELERLAMERAAQISLYYSHTLPDGSDTFSSWTPSVSVGTISENIAAGQESALAVNTSWNLSPGHYRNRTFPENVSMGAAGFMGADGDMYWVELFSGAEGSGMSGSPDDSAVSCEVPASPDRVVRIDEPRAVEGLTYTGSTLTGVKGGTGYAVRGGTARVAGGHTATVWPTQNRDLPRGYCWSDGTNQAKTIDWSIAKAAPDIEVTPSSLELEYPSGEGDGGSVGSCTIRKPIDATCTASTSDGSVATASVSGEILTVTARGVGTAAITVASRETDNYTSGSCDLLVRVKQGRLPSSVLLSQEVLSLRMGGSAREVSVSGVGDGALSARSSNEGVASARVSGTTVVVTPVGVGTCTVTVSRGEIDAFTASSATLHVTVAAEAEPPEDTSGDRPSSGRPSGDAVDMYRMYNPYTGEHLYTASAVERDTMRGCGWDYEGVMWRAPKSSSTPIYRLYNPYSGDHHYARTRGEYDTLRRQGWRGEGIAFFSAGTDGVPIYRLFNPYQTKIGTHNYTDSERERDANVSAGWRYEEVGWYGLR